MLVAAHQPLFIPWIGYFDKINKVDLFVIVDNVWFTSSGWIRRNRIKNSTGVQKLIIPIKRKKHLGQLIKDIEIDNERNFRWKKIHLNAFLTNYGKAPYFGEIMPILDSIYAKKWDLLCDFNIALIEVVCKYLKIRTELVKSSDIGISGKKTELLVDICQKTGADSFMLGMGGSLVYTDQDYLKSKGINIVMQNFKHPVYSQRYGDFISDLSILDFLFNMGTRSSQIIKESSS